MRSPVGGTIVNDQNILRVFTNLGQDIQEMDLFIEDRQSRELSHGHEELLQNVAIRSAVLTTAILRLAPTENQLEEVAPHFNIENGLS